MSCNTKLRDVADFQKGFAFKSKDYQDTGVKIVKVSNLTNDSIDLSQCVCIDNELSKKYNDKYELMSGDIIITTVGSWPTNPASVVGKVIKVPTDANNTLLNQNAVRVRSNSNINQRYLYYLLKNETFKEYIVGTAQGSANQASITQEDIKNFEFELHPLKEQEKIANILSSLDDKIQLNNEMNKTLEEMAQSLFKRWFVDFEFPNEDGEPYKSSGGDMVDSELGMIPKGWEVKQLGEVIKITSGKRPKNKSKDKNEEYDTPIIGASSIMGYTNDFLYNERILVIGRVGTHGVVQRFKSKVWTSDNTFVIKSETYEYINQILKSIDYSSLNRGSTQPLITQTDIKNVLIVYPKYELLNKFEDITSELLNRVEFNLENNIILSNLRDSLLPKLMSGEIKV